MNSANTYMKTIYSVGLFVSVALFIMAFPVAPFAYADGEGYTDEYTSIHFYFFLLSISKLLKSEHPNKLQRQVSEF